MSIHTQSHLCILKLDSLFIVPIARFSAVSLYAFCHVTKTITQPGRFAEAPPMVTQFLLVNFEEESQIITAIEHFY